MEDGSDSCIEQLHILVLKCALSCQQFLRVRNKNLRFFDSSHLFLQFQRKSYSFYTLKLIFPIITWIIAQLISSLLSRDFNSTIIFFFFPLGYTFIFLFICSFFTHISLPLPNDWQIFNKNCISLQSNFLTPNANLAYLKDKLKRMRWLDGIINSVDMNLSGFREIVKDRETWCAIVHGVAKLNTTM